MAAHNELGKWGEEVATAYLRDKGYIIVERDWHSQHRDLDIIALDDGVMVFIEVKTRQTEAFAHPDQTITRKKLHNLQLAINHYVKGNNVTRRFRIDIITVIGKGDKEPEIRHLTDVSIW